MAARKDERHPGPDWADVGMMLREMQKLHEGSTVTIRLESDGAKFGSSLYVIARAVAPQFEDQARPWTREVTVGWPSHQHKDVVGAAFFALHKLDALMCRDLWKQETFA